MVIVDAHHPAIPAPLKEDLFPTNNEMMMASNYQPTNTSSGHTSHKRGFVLTRTTMMMMMVSNSFFLSDVQEGFHQELPVDPTPNSNLEREYKRITKTPWS